jgi:hypothetical protein
MSVDGMCRGAMSALCYNDVGRFGGNDGNGTEGIS